MRGMQFLFFFNDTATTEIYTLSLHDALPIFGEQRLAASALQEFEERPGGLRLLGPARDGVARAPGDVDRALLARGRSEEHTSELQSRQYLVCRLLLEKKNRPRLHCSLPAIHA